MKKIIYISLICLMISTKGFSQFNTVGSAVSTGNNCFTLTNSTGQAGAVWNTSQVNLSQPFDITLILNFGCTGNGSDDYTLSPNCGADGMTFVLQPLNSSVSSMGGAVGFGGITPSLGVIMDDYTNGPDDNIAYDGHVDHMSISKNGNVIHGSIYELVPPSVPAGNGFPSEIENCQDYLFHFVWTPGTPNGTLQVYFGGVLMITYTADIINSIFNGNPMVYWGMSGSTGACMNVQTVCMAVQSAFINSQACGTTTATFTDQSVSNTAIVGYLWDFGDGNTSTLQSPVHTYATPGTYTVSLTITNFDGIQSSVSHQVVIHGMTVSASASPTTVCAGQTTTLTGVITTSPANNYTYIWNPIGVTNTITPFVTPTVPTTYTLSVTDSYGCTTTADVSIDIGPGPVLTNSPLTQAVCSGDNTVPITLTSNMSGATFFWTSAATSGITGNPVNGTSTIPLQTLITSSSTPGTVTYTITPFAYGCTGTPASYVITVNPPPSPLFTALTPVCVNNASSVVYTGGSSPLSYAWTFTNSPSVAPALGGPGPYSVTWSSVGVQTISLQVTNTVTGCISAVYNQSVQVNPAGTVGCCITPLPSAGNDNLFVCGLSYTLQGSLPAPGNTGTWTALSGLANFADPHANGSIVTVASAGDYYFVWTEVSGQCNNADTVHVKFYQPPIANAGNDVQVCGQTAQVSATPTVGTGSWSMVPPMNASFTPNQGTATATVHALTGYGNYYFVWTEVNGSCASKDTMLVQFLQIPVTYAGDDKIGCGNITTLSADSTYPGFWTASINNVIYTSDYADPSPDIWIPSPTASVYPVQFIWHVYNGICPGSDTVVVTFMKPPHVEAGPQQNICGTQTQLAADTIGSGIINAFWTSNVPGLAINYSGGDPIPWNPSINATALVPAFWQNSLHEVWLFWHGQNGPGCLATDSVEVTFYEIPNAHAGIDTAVCGKAYTMTGDWSISNHTGIWSTLNVPVAGATADFTPSSLPNSFVTVSDFGIWDFIWKESNAANTTCLDRDTIRINFRLKPTPDAGNDQQVCGKFAYVCASMSPGVSAGQWSCPGGGIAFYNANNGNYTPANQFQPCTWVRYSSENDTVTMYWSEFNGVCYGYDSVNVYFSSIQNAMALVSHSDSINCGPVCDFLNAQWPAVGTGHWIDTVQSTQYTPSQSATHAIASIYTGNDDYYGWHHFYWVTTNGICSDTSEVVSIKFVKYPEPNAGGHYWPALFGVSSHIKTDTVCGLNYQMAPIPSIGTGTWYTTMLLSEFLSTGSPSTPVYNDSLYLNCYDCYSVFSSGNQYNQYIWQENNQTCVKSDTLNLYFAPNPSGQFATTVPACRHLPYTSRLEARTWPQPNDIDYGITHYQWEFPSGTSVSPGFDVPVQNVGWQIGETHSVRLITFNRWNCHSGVYTQTVHEPQKFAPIDSIVPASCGQNNGQIFLSTFNNNNANYFTFEWWPHSAFSNFSSSFQQELSAFSVNSVIAHGQTLSPDTFGITCSDTLSYSIPNSGAIDAVFDTTVFLQHQAAPYKVDFVNLTQNGRKYSWRIFNSAGNLIYTTTAQNPSYEFESEGCYDIVLVATSKQGCMDTMKFVPLCVDANPLLEIPNVFTPNNDGQNDIFRIHGESIEKFNCIIFNRWGRKLYEWNDVNGYWDGKTGNEEASPGVYYYYLKASDKKGKEYNQNGFFYLLKEK